MKAHAVVSLDNYTTLCGKLVDAVLVITVSYKKVSCPDCLKI